MRRVSYGYRVGTSSSARSQRGQALVFIAVTTVIVLLVTLATFNVGQLAYHRMKLQNTADAAAYSAAVAHARSLNFSAYMNRGMIANQVAVTQIVSLTGWIRNYDDTYNGEFATISDVLSSLSSLQAMWKTPFNIIKSIASSAKSAIDAAAPVAVKALDVLIDALYYASLTYNYGMLAEIPLETIPNVIRENEPEAELAGPLTSFSVFGTAVLANSILQAKNFVGEMKPAENKDGDLRMAYVTQASTDLFYKNRSLPPIWPVPFLIDPTRLVTYGVGPLFMIQFHSGGSSLKQESSSKQNHLQGITSLDATGLFVIMCVTIPILGIPVPIPFPLPPLPAGRGMAGAGQSAWMDGGKGLTPFIGADVEHRNAGNTGVDSAAAVHYGAAHINPMTAIPAWIGVAEGAGTSLDTRAGIRNYLDVAKNVTSNGSGSTSNAASTAATNNNKNDVAPAWVIEVERPANTLLTSYSGGYTIGGGTDGQLSLPASTEDDRMRAMSRAEAYFSRPKTLFPREGDDKTEWGSLYSPYWQARLQPNTLLEQAGSILNSEIF